MENKIYEKKIKSYEVVVLKNNRIELHVYHQNKEIRKYLKNHENDPKYFLERRDSYKKNNLSAKRYLAQVINDYRPYFEKGLVELIFSDLVSKKHLQ